MVAIPNQLWMLWPNCLLTQPRPGCWTSGTQQISWALLRPTCLQLVNTRPGAPSSTLRMGARTWRNSSRLTSFTTQINEMTDDAAVSGPLRSHVQGPALSCLIVCPGYQIFNLSQLSSLRPLAKPAEFGVFQRHFRSCCRVCTHVHGCPTCLASIFVSVVSGLQPKFILSSGFGYFFHSPSSYLRGPVLIITNFLHIFCFNSVAQHNSPSMTLSPSGSCSLIVLFQHHRWLISTFWDTRPWLF